MIITFTFGLIMTEKYVKHIDSQETWKTTIASLKTHCVFLFRGVLQAAKTGTFSRPQQRFYRPEGMMPKYTGHIPRKAF